jgi:hypothetical protein
VGEGKGEGVDVIAAAEVGEFVLVAASIGAIIAAWVFSTVIVIWDFESIILHAAKERKIVTTQAGERDRT